MSTSAGPVVTELRAAGVLGVDGVLETQVFLLDGTAARGDVERVAGELLCDSVTHVPLIATAADFSAATPGATGLQSVEVHPRPGVMDPVAESTLAELQAEGVAVTRVRTARRYYLAGEFDLDAALPGIRRVLSNDCVEQTFAGSAGVPVAPEPPVYEFRLLRVAVRELDEAGLEELSRRGHLFLSLAEMQTIQGHFRELGREPTDLELETLAQTWSEHCVHKTLKSEIVYRGAGMPRIADFGLRSADSKGGGGKKLLAADPQPATVELRYGNLLKDTIARVTRELMAEKRGPECLSVFVDNAGVIAFDDEFGVAFKVETHNRPSAIEPYGGAATGAGGCIRDVMGCGLGARPIATTDVFCVAPSDWPADGLPRGVLHPRRVLRGVIKGVADYGNRMGIPTVNGAIQYDARYLGNPLVFCGCLGLIPRDILTKAARPGDLVVVVGGRTGRDGIHGATFSSAELTDTHADEFSHAVQIGNAITEKRVLDAILKARDADGGCLYSAITDCGAGGLSSAVGEMAVEVGAVVDLEKVPLKYAGLRYDEIWISEAQERMVLAVPPGKAAKFLEVMKSEETEATVIGTFGHGGDGARPRLQVRYQGQVVGDLDMHFLHEGLPRGARQAEWNGAGAMIAPSNPSLADFELDGAAILAELSQRLAEPSAASKEWVIRQYDHEVQGATVVKPLCGPACGPSDAAVLRPRPTSWRGVALGCGLAPHLSDVDPYWMAVDAIDEAIRNVVCVGGDPRQTAILDNFCWGRTDDPKQLGALVRACQACYDTAKVFGTPFVSGKDSLNNEFALGAEDVEPLIGRLRAYFADERQFAAIAARIRDTRRLSIPATLLISAMSIVPDIRACRTADLKERGNPIFLVGGLPQVNCSLALARRIHVGVADLITDDVVVAVHDCGDGWLPAVAEMAIAGRRGAEITVDDAGGLLFFDRCNAGYVVEVREAERLRFLRLMTTWGLPHGRIGGVVGGADFTLLGCSQPLASLDRAWRNGSRG